MKWQNELQLAEIATKNAGEYLNASKTKKEKVLSDHGKDIKLDADQKTEELILNILQSNSPYPVLTEETGVHGSIDSTTGYYWIVDPIDGTLNYNRGIPLCCSSVGLWQGMKPILGAVYDFRHDEIFSGLVGQSATRNNTKIGVSDIDSADKAILGTGFPVKRNFGESSLNEFLSSVQRFKKVRLFGTAALSLAYVACGYIDAYAEEDIFLWDIAAGAALVIAAGGFVDIKKSEHLKYGVIIKAAANSTIWD